MNNSNDLIDTLDTFSIKTESTIAQAIEIRNLLSSFKSFDEFTMKKGNIISILFGIEDHLRNTNDLLKKKYFEQKKALISNQPPLLVKEDNTIIKQDMQNDSLMTKTFHFDYDLDKTNHLQQNELLHNAVYQSINDRPNLQQTSLTISKHDDYNDEDAEEDLSINLHDQQANKSYNSPIKDMPNNNHYQFNRGINPLTHNNPIEDNQINSQYTNYYNNNLKQLKTNDIIKQHNIHGNYSQNSLLNNAQISSIPYDNNNSSITNDLTAKPSFNNQKQPITNKQSNDNNNTNTINHYQSNPYACQINDVLSNSSNSQSHYNKQKASRVADLIMKLNSDEDLYEMISQIFSNTIIDELISSKVTNELIESVEEAIKEIKILQDNDNNNESSSHFKTIQPQNNSMNKTPLPKSSSNPYMYSSPNTCHEKTRSQNNTQALYMKNLQNKYPKSSKTIIGKDNNTRKDIRFENTLRKCTSPLSSGRVFNNYTSARSNYFDPSLQNGGQSKLSNKKRNLKGRKDISPSNQYQYINFTVNNNMNNVGEYQYSKPNH